LTKKQFYNKNSFIFLRRTQGGTSKIQDKHKPFRKNIPTIQNRLSFWGVGIRNPGVKKAPDPKSGSARHCLLRIKNRHFLQYLPTSGVVRWGCSASSSLLFSMKKRKKGLVGFFFSAGFAMGAASLKVTKCEIVFF
jgi:hypothetical protein